MPHARLARPASAPAGARLRPRRPRSDDRASVPARRRLASALRTLAALGVGLDLAAASVASAQMEIDDLIVTAGPAGLDGVFTDYFVDTVVFGSEIASVTVSTGSGVVVSLVEPLEDEFICDDVPGEPCEDFESLAELDALGSLTFDFVGESGELDTIVVPAADWIPGPGQVGTPMLVSPAPGDPSLPPGNAFVWASAPAWVELISVDLVDVALDDGIDEALFTDPGVTSWTPTGVVPGVTYAFELSFLDAYFLEDARVSVGGRPYLFSSGFQAFESKYVPEPSGGPAWIAALAALTTLAARRRP